MRDDGFTIVEALTAVAILTVSLVALYGAGADAVNATDHVNHMERAVLFAQSKLEEMALVLDPLPMNEQGEERSGQLQWTVSAHVHAPTASASESNVLQDVVLEIRWREGANTRSLSVETRHLGIRRS